MHSNLRLVLVGLVFGLLSAVYPRLPSYLPYSVASRLPFLSASLLDPDLSKTWQSVQRYQHSVPISQNYEHSPEARWEEEIEKQLRFGSKEGGREMDKELKRVRREVEKRTEHAGKENMIKHNLPVYYLDEDLASSSLSAIGKEINSLVPLSVVVLFANPTSSTRHLLLSSTTQLSYAPSPKLVQSLLTSFASHAPNPVPAVSSSLVSLPTRVEAVVSSLALDRAIKLTLVGVPPAAGETKEALWDVGAVLHQFRHSHHDHHHVTNPKARSRHAVDDSDDEDDDAGPFAAKKHDKKLKGERDLLELSKRTVVVSIGQSISRTAPTASSFASSLRDVLEHSTSHARSLSLAALCASAAGHKPTKALFAGAAGVVIAAEAAGEGEAERIALASAGEAWRFGGLPIR
ncbi:hypothetical protein JCM11491_005033 [Sporobolomyces phaffii]